MGFRDGPRAFMASLYPPSCHSRPPSFLWRKNIRLYTHTIALLHLLMDTGLWAAVNEHLVQICWVLFSFGFGLLLFWDRVSLTMQPRLVLNSWASCLCLLNAEVPPPKAWLMGKFLCGYLFSLVAELLDPMVVVHQNFVCMYTVYMWVLYVYWVYTSIVCVHIHVKSRCQCWGCPSVTCHLMFWD